MNPVEQVVEALRAAARYALVHGPGEQAAQMFLDRACEMERWEAVEGGCYHYGGAEPNFAEWDFNKFRRDEDRPAILLVRKESDNG